MPVNLEVKAQIGSIAEARKTAVASGAEARGVMMQVDTYFMVPHGRLKLREIDEMSAELITYERPEDDPRRWSKYEKTPVPEPGHLREMLGAALGVLVTVKKTRELFLLEGSRIHLDTVEGLGTFMEFEVPARGENDERARGIMSRLLRLFAIRDADLFPHSYSDMMLRRRL